MNVGHEKYSCNSCNSCHYLDELCPNTHRANIQSALNALGGDAVMQLVVEYKAKLDTELEKIRLQREVSEAFWEEFYRETKATEKAIRERWKAKFEAVGLKIS